MIKQQFGFQITGLRGLAKNSFMINVIAALPNPFLVRRHFSQQCEQGNGVPKHLDSGSNTSQMIPK